MTDGPQISRFQLVGEPANATPMAKYMKNQFPFVGVKTPARLAQSKALLHASLQVPTPAVMAWSQALYRRSEREYQYVAIDLAKHNWRRFSVAELLALRPLVVAKPWWDTVDAWRVVYGRAADADSAVKRQLFDVFEASDNFWERRIALNLQLMSKDQTDLSMLQQAILRDRETPEFFIQKAIGWALRQYSKTDPQWVRAFISGHQLSKLAVREGSKYLDR
ncbi:DNA alkylation repair protein [Lacticaseibacillus hegangensis]|uniref:DNA alkylation repair protein n=1 Tax=Lacticaseibacillus hegangensis TaxID=2486010 RepID=A0ABW4CZ15_9LACO|nr:DNA alkylation repair protein [Lacticaseibacillus hegangensis]